ncbi:MAG: DUF4349 domain-containing protein [Myxococcales bacterium]|nr:DUF4349 domain-containing protein [Myxococcales bacterium]
MRYLIALATALLLSCGGAHYAMQSPASFDKYAGGGEAEQYAAFSVTEKKVAEQSIAQQKVAAAQKDAPAAQAPQIVYLGYLKLRVRRLLEAVDQLTARIESAGGYVESLSAQVLVARVPAGDFDAAMARLAEVGTVLDRRVKALDVTEQFTDLQGRLTVARDTRERLLALLEQTSDTAERLRILQQIKRLTEQIESIESTLATLKNLVDFYTITIALEPIVENQRAVVHRSPFGWVQRLEAHVLTIADGGDDVHLTPPKGFVRFEDDDDWRAQAADTTVLRAGVVSNEPRGDAAFWAAAVRHEMDGRDEEALDAGTVGRLHWAIYREKDLNPRSWLIAVYAEGEDLYVIEAFFPDPESYSRHREAVVASLSSFRPE